MSSSPDGLLPWSWASERLAGARNYWIAPTRADGRPHVMPVWGAWFDGGLRFGSSPRSRKAKNLARDPRAIVHLESGDEAVIVEGVVEPLALDERTADAYAEKYDLAPGSCERVARRGLVRVASVARLRVART